MKELSGRECKKVTLLENRNCDSIKDEDKTSIRNPASALAYLYRQCCVLCRASLLARLHLGRFLIFHHLPYPMQFHTQGVFIVPCSPSFWSTPLPRNIRASFSTTALPRGVANLKGGGGKYNEIYIMYY